jgi:hypothetical protein
MGELCQNILSGNGAVISLNLHYSLSLRDLLKEMLLKNSNLRPGINMILSRPVGKYMYICMCIYMC